MARTDSGDVEQETLLGWQKPAYSEPLGRRWMWLGLLFSHVCIAILAYGLTNLHCIKEHDEDLSPWMSTIDRSLHTSRFNAFEVPNAFTAPTYMDTDVENRWMDLGSYSKAMLIPIEYAQDFDIDLDVHAHFTRKGESGVVNEGFPAIMEFVHQLHCLDLLRQGLYYNHEYYRQIHSVSWMQNDTKVLDSHLAHCVDSLRQLIICEADIRVVPFLTSTRSIDAARNKKCKNFESARHFAVQNQWDGADDFELDENHRGSRAYNPPQWTMEKLWRGY